MKKLLNISNINWWTVLLSTSLSLNLFIGGVIVATLISGPHGGGDEDLDAKRQQGTPFISALTNEQRFELGEKLRSLGFGHDEEHVKMGESARHVMEVLTAENFDLDMFTQAVKAHDSVIENRRAVVQQLFIKTVSDFDKAQRELYAMRLKVMLHEFISEFIEH
jgi:hypothetical protein